MGLLAEFSSALAKARKSGRLKTAEQREAFRSSWDWEKMTAQDPAVWDAILAHLEK